MSRTLPTLLAIAAAASGVAQAAIRNPTAGAAMRKGVRDVARVEAGGAKATRIRTSCVAVPKVNDRKPCRGSFDLTKDGRTAHYTLTRGARTIRISPGAIEYRVAARATRKVEGLPAATDLLGFLQ